MIPYFSHDIFAREDLKIKRLISAMTLEGYGIFWGVIEFLHNTSNKIRLDEIQLVADDLCIEKEKLESVIFDFNLFSVKKNVISSRRVAKNLKLQKEKSKKARTNASKRWQAFEPDAVAMPSQCRGNAIKEKKGKENKKKEMKEKETSETNETEAEKTVENTAEFFSHGTHSNVFLSPVQRSSLLAQAKSETLLNEVIEEFSTNIATKKESIFDESYSEMHFLRLERYLKQKNSAQGKAQEKPKDDPTRYDALNHIKKLKAEGGVAPPPEFLKSKEALMRRFNISD